ncbi:MAG: hypothetical protein JHD15_15920 [Phenylobacterium sp.]|jgi:hypothetical protein|uniref:hypothetical protein n=1 Tax=unclassified Phenylobacterium TaxID=2640670 RepID=UPI0008D89FDB|nr:MULTISPECIES: hypothetical protein [unclassified Phenylobacterium]MBJ7411834.1 hypothetical protein [Phenylobacterium sp.]OHB28530.1 MAG: hypothetical protein A2790_16110 [Phenylobacterium sp. RIFCSPHIGHO2_01_FULL_69_31]
MPAYTIVTTSAAQGSDAAEVNTLVDDFANESEAVGYARRMADEMLGLAGQLALDFDYSNVAIHEGDLIDEELEPADPSFVGMWVLDEAGAAFVGADEIREDAAEEGDQQ